MNWKGVVKIVGCTMKLVKLPFKLLHLQLLH